MKKISIFILTTLLITALANISFAETVDFDVKLNVLPFADIDTPGEFSINLFDRNSTNNSVSNTFTITTNYDIRLDVSSTGFTNSLLDDYVTYKVNNSRPITPGESGGAANVLNIRAGSKDTATFTVTINEDGILANEAWETLSANTVLNDTVTLTVSAQ